MKGEVLGFNSAAGKGAISGSDGKRYSFRNSDVQSSSPLMAGSKVDFEVSERGAAIEIYAQPNVYQPYGNVPKSKVAAALFAFFFGSFGAHKFYLGYTTEGIIMLVIFFGGIFLLAIPSIIIGCIAFIEFILYLVKSDDEFDEIYVQNKRGWF